MSDDARPAPGNGLAQEDPGGVRLRIVLTLHADGGLQVEGAPLDVIAALGILEIAKVVVVDDWRQRRTQERRIVPAPSGLLMPQ